MNKLEKQIESILKEANIRLLTETAKSNDQERYVKEVIEALLKNQGIKCSFEKAGGTAPFDIDLRIAPFTDKMGNKHPGGTFLIEVKELTRKGLEDSELAKLGSSKTVSVVMDRYISSLQQLAIEAARYFKFAETDPNEIKQPFLKWWVEIRARAGRKRYDAIIAYEMSDSLFAEITDGFDDFKQNQLLPMATYLKKQLTNAPEKGFQARISVSVKGAETGSFDVDNETLKRVQRAIRSGEKVKQAENPAAEEKEGEVLDLLDKISRVISTGDAQMEIQPDEKENLSGGFKGYRQTLARASAGHGGVVGVIGVRTTGTETQFNHEEVNYYRLKDLSSKRMTQGGRLVLQPRNPVRLDRQVDPTAFLIALGALPDPTEKPSAPTAESKVDAMVRDIIKEVLKL